MDNEQLKESVKNYWNQASCGTEFIKQKRFSREYFEAIETFRYAIEPEIFSFAQFTRFHNKKVLEIGVGAGTDFIQWIRAGAQAYGIDLTQEAIDNVQHRLRTYNLCAKDIRVDDAENLSYPDNFFDLVYSWGVIHHSPDTNKCLYHIIRVTKPGGTIKLMVYNRHSLFAFYRYLICGLFKGKPFKSFSSILSENQESSGTKAYTFREIKKMTAHHSVTLISLRAPATNHDLLYYKSRFCQWFAYCLACIRGWNKAGWFLMIELKKKKS
jgi:ubiquinone/menaquinone biosynthesis C-methylase UbiE